MIDMKNKLTIKLKECRLSKGLTQKELAEKLGYGRSSIGDWESGRTEPSLDVLISLAQFFGESVDYMLGLED